MSWIEIKEKREQANKLVADAGKLVAAAKEEKRSLTAEENEAFDKYHNDSESLLAEARRIERQEEAEKSLEQRIGRDDVSPVDSRESNKVSEKRVFEKFLREGKQSLSAEEKRALTKGTATEGAELVPESFADFFVEKYADLSSLEEAGAQVIVTSSGRDIPVPVIDDSSNTGELLAEGDPASEDSDPATGEVILKAYAIDSKVVPVSVHLLEDGAWPVEEWLGNALARRVADRSNHFFTNGTGTNQPGGVKVKATDSGILASSASGTKYVDVLDLKYGLKKRYRNQNSKFMMNSNMLVSLKKLTDTTGRPLWQPGFDATGPTLDGNVYVVNDDLEDVDILFGDFSQYVIRRVRGVELLRFDDSAYMKKMQVGFMAFVRTDGNLVNTEAIHHYAWASHSGQAE